MSPLHEGVRAAGSLYLRPETIDDREFLADLYISTREAELPYFGKALLRTQYEMRRMQYLARFPGTAPSVIATSHAPCGTLWLAESADEIRIVDIALLPQFRNRGLGTNVLLDLISRADLEFKPLTLTVSKTNPGACRLYQRLGFVIIEDLGMDLAMRREPRS